MVSIRLERGAVPLLVKRNVFEFVCSAANKPPHFYVSWPPSSCMLLCNLGISIRTRRSTYLQRRLSSPKLQTNIAWFCLSAIVGLLGEIASPAYRGAAKVMRSSPQYPRLTSLRLYANGSKSSCRKAPHSRTPRLGRIRLDARFPTWTRITSSTSRKTRTPTTSSGTASCATALLKRLHGICRCSSHPTHRATNGALPCFHCTPGWRHPSAASCPVCRRSWRQQR